MNAHVRRIDNSPSPLDDVSLFLSSFLSVSFWRAHARLIYEAFSLSRGGGEAIEWQLRTIARSETKERVGKLLPPRPRVETAASRCGEIGEMEDGLLKRSWGERSWDQEKDRRRVIIRFLHPFFFSFFLAVRLDDESVESFGNNPSCTMKRLRWLSYRKASWCIAASTMDDGLIYSFAENWICSVAKQIVILKNCGISVRFEAIREI